MTTETANAIWMEEAPGLQESVELLIPVGGMTCQSCVGHVRGALEGVPGVLNARVDLAARQARVRFDPGRASVLALQEAIEAVGYVAGEPTDATASVSDATAARGGSLATGSWTALKWPGVFGVAAALALVAFYLGSVTLAQGADHAVELLSQDWYFVVPIVLGFGIQVGLFVYARRGFRHLRGARSATAVSGVGTGASSISMVACCAHHLTDLLPLIGISGAALFLNDYRQPLMLLGIATNLVGIAVMSRMIRRMRRTQPAA